MGAKRLLVLPTGSCFLSESRIRRGGSSTEIVEIPMPMYAIDTDDGWIIYDTGCDPNVAIDPSGTWGKLANAYRIEMKNEDHQLARLASIGVTPKDVSHVVASHLHMDHAGGLRFFQDSIIHVQKAEFRWAHFPDKIASAGYVASDFDSASLNFQLDEGDKEIVPGVYVILTDGHTPGHQSLIVDLPSGRFLLTGDCAYERSQIDRLIPPPVTTDEVAAVRSLARVRAIEIRDNATVLVAHDSKAWLTTRIAPEAEYE